MRNKRWKNLVALALVSTLVLTAPLQTGALEDVDFVDEEQLTEVEETGLVDSEEDLTEPDVEVESVTMENAPAQISKLAEGQDPVAQTIYPSSAPEEEGAFKDQPTVWLHVVNGNIAWSDAEGNSDDGMELTDGDVLVKLGDDRTLPESVKTCLSVTRTNGEFVGWYTEAPTEELQTSGDYSVWKTVKVNGTIVSPGRPVPEGVNVLYAVFNDKPTADDGDKVLEFYLDWNGIDGMFGHCLTCIRKYKAGGDKTKFTAEDAAVIGLNYEAQFDDQFENADDKWVALKKIWAENTFNGYTFLGWSTEEKSTVLVEEDTEITNGMSFYAQWKKADGSSSETFERVDPEAKPLKDIRIVAGEGTQFLSGTLHASTHAEEGASLALNLFCTPVRTTVKKVVWTVKVSKSVSDPAALLSNANSEPKEVEMGETETFDGVKVEAEGTTLKVTNVANDDNKQRVITVSATATGTDGKTASAPTEATLAFSHSWNEVVQDELPTPTCTENATITYECTVDGCKATKEEKLYRLNHVYEKHAQYPEGVNKYYKVIDEPTCTQPGKKQFICLRCKELDKTEHDIPVLYDIPALGHDWGEETTTPASCNKDMVTKTCERCGTQEASLVPAYHPELHKWVETDRYHNTCMSDIVYEKCSVCGETRQRNEAANNPDRHSYAYDSSMRYDCQQVLYTFKCVHGCGSTQVMLKQEEGHDWGGWTVSTRWNKTTGGMETVRTRECKRCGKTETETIEQIAGGTAATEAEKDTPTTEKQSEAQTEAQKETQPETQKETQAQTETEAQPETSVETVTETGAGTIAIAGNSVAVTQPVSYAAETAAAETAVQSAPAAETSEEQVGGLQKVGKKTYYIGEDGSKKTGWQTIDGKKYYFGKNGVMKTGWQTIKGKKYYFGKDGVMRTGKQKIGKKKYTFSKNGVLKK